MEMAAPRSHFSLKLKRNLHFEPFPASFLLVFTRTLRNGRRMAVGCGVQHAGDLLGRPPPRERKTQKEPGKLSQTSDHRAVRLGFTRWFSACCVAVFQGCAGYHSAPAFRKTHEVGARLTYKPTNPHTGPRACRPGQFRYLGQWLGEAVINPRRWGDDGGTP